jgi:hypothetical protein
MTGHTVSGLLALGPVRAAAESIEQVLALPEFETDTVVIVGDARRFAEKREAYLAIFGALGRAGRAVLWVPEPGERPFERELRRAYEGPRVRPSTDDARVLLFAPPAPSPSSTLLAHEILDELTATFAPRLAARVQRPALFLVRDRGAAEWLEL